MQIEKIEKHAKLEDVQKFLVNLYSEEIQNLTHIAEGKHSDAFSFSVEGQSLVCRVNISDLGFKKDEYAYEYISSTVIPVPKVLQIGKYEESLFYCISEIVPGVNVRMEYKNGHFTSLPMQFQVIEEIAKIPVVGEFYGRFEADEAAKQTQEEYFTNLTTADGVDFSQYENLDYYDKDFVKYLQNKIQELNKFIDSKQRVLCHGDFGGTNLFVHEGKISGVIDWDQALYGIKWRDVARVVLFSENKFETTKAAMEFYKDKEENFKEKILWGVYVVMLRNYKTALNNGIKGKASCLSSKDRISEIEKYINL